MAAARGTRWVSAGLADQAVIALANAGNTLLPLGLFGKGPRAGNLVLAIGLGYFVLSLNRAFVGDVLLAQVSRLDGAARDRMVRHALATGATIGALAGAVLLIVWAVWPNPGAGIDLRDLVWVAPFLPLVLLHDTGRYTYLSEREPARALVIDLVWVGVQAAVIGTMMATGHTSPGLLLASWGVGAGAGAATFLVRSGARPWRGDPRRWAAETRHLSGWFTAANLIGQLQVQAVAFVVAGRLSRGDLAVLRSGQTALLQPVQNLVTAMMGLLVPRSSRLAGVGDSDGLRRQTAKIAAIFAGFAVVMISIVVPVAHVLQSHLGRYAEIVPLALPISIQAGIYLMQIPFTAAIRAMQRGRLVFAQYLVFTATSMTGLVLGAGQGLVPAVWGLTAGAAVGLLAMIALYASAIRRLPTPTPAVAATSGLGDPGLGDPDLGDPGEMGAMLSESNPETT